MQRTAPIQGFWKLCAVLAVGWGWLNASGPTPASSQNDAAGIEFFEKNIRPVLVENCYKCHSNATKKHKGNLLLDSQAGMRKGGDGGAAVVPGQPDKSLLLRALRYGEDLRMPPAGKLSAKIIADFEKWIAQGAQDPREGDAVVTQEVDWNKARRFWSFQQPVKPELPIVQNVSWSKTPIDTFILAKMEEEKLQPVRSAGKRELIRRATFDLTGLPPTPEEVDAFLKDQSSDAFAKVIDRLLASPHYGERWGRYWLDVARYAEDQAHTFDVKLNTSAWRYRDWVINALNADMPFDRFVKLQLAADLIVKDDPERIKHLPALGFIGLGAQYYKNSDAAKAAADELDDRVDTVTRGFLGLTVSCARCHDHKFDPIPQQDYYSLAGVFGSCKLTNLPLAPVEQQNRFKEVQDKIKKLEGEVKNILRDERVQLGAQGDQVAQYLLAAWKFQVHKQQEPQAAVNDFAKANKLDAEILKRSLKFVQNPGPNLELFKKPSAPEIEVQALAEKLQQQFQGMPPLDGKALEKDKEALVQKLFLAEKAVFFVPDAQVRAKLIGEKKQRVEQLTEEAERLQKSDAAKPLPVAHALTEASPANMKVFLRGNPAKQGEEAPRRFLRILCCDTPPTFKQGSGRLELAEAIASRDNPLTARILVNRVWQNHFGRGLVGTPSNFGQLGDRPTHPELLDYLACQFMESGWSLKKLHREIMLSAVYHLSSEPAEQNFARDGDNRWLWHMNRRRLDIEAWRDAMLTVSGKLDRALGGPTLDLSASSNVRRTVYAKISRHDLNYLLRLFDFPDANITSERRNETTVPQQQLFVINSPFVIEQAKAFAARVQKETTDETARVQRAYQLAYGRAASPEELSLAMNFLSGRDDALEQSRNRLTRWERLAQIVLGSNEFLYID